MKYLIFFLVVLLLLNQTKFSFGAITYGVLLFSFCIFLINNKFKVKFDLGFFFLITACLISIIVNDIPAVFNVYGKFSGFLVLLLFASNLVNNNYIIFLRNTFINYFYYIGLVVAGLSFFGVLFNIIPRFNENETAGGFSSVFSNSIFFGAYLAVLMLLTYGKWDQTKNKKYLIYFIVLSYLLILTGARSAILCFLVAILYFIFRNYGLGSFLIKYWYVFIILPVLFINNIGNEHFKVINSKIEMSNNLGRNSRELLWNNRITEFSNNPFFGGGFNSVDLSISQYEFKEDSGSIEPGSSWLFLLSTLGVFGVFCFFLGLRKVFINLVKKGDGAKYITDSLFVFFLAHFIFEGYIFAVGNILIYIFFMICCLIQNRKIINN